MSVSLPSNRAVVPLALVVAGLTSSSYAQLDSANDRPNTGPVVEIFHDRGDTFVRAGTAQGLKVGAMVEVLGPTIGGTEERRTVGIATVLEVWETLSRVSLDKAASGYSGAKLARVKAEPAKAVVQPPSPPPMPPPVPPALEPLKGRAAKSFQRITLSNDSGIHWTNCDVRLPSNKRYLLARLAAGDHEAIMVFRFAADGIPRDLPDSHLIVKCDQGEAKFAL